MPNEISTKLLLKDKELISESHLAKIVLIIHQRTYGSNCFHQSLAATTFSKFLIVLVWLFFFFSNDFVRKMLRQKSLNFYF